MGHAISSGVKPHLLVFQKAKYFFKKRPQFFLVVFIEGEFAEPHPLLLICQISQISCGISSCTIAGTLLNAPSAKHLSLIQENAWFMAEELQKLQCELSQLLRPNLWEKCILSPEDSNTKLQ